MDDLFGDLPPPSSDKKPVAPSAAPKAGTDVGKDHGREGVEVAVGEPAPKRSKADTTDDNKQQHQPPEPVRVAVEAVVYGSKGRRKTMEDAHVCLDNAACHELCPELPQDLRVCVYGIMDGHGGVNVANLVAEELPRAILRAIAGELGESFEPQSLGRKVTGCLSDAFREVAKVVEEQATRQKWADGCCCVLLLVVQDLAFVANLGDSKALLCMSEPEGEGEGGSAGPSPSLPWGDVGGTGGSGSHLLHRFPWESGSEAGAASTSTIKSMRPPRGRARVLTQDHKPDKLHERRRIEKAGGSVVNGRVNGQLEVSRTFGDVALRRFGVTSEPELGVQFKLRRDLEFLLLACDGLWARYDHNNVAAFVRNRLWAGESWCQGVEERWSLGKVCRALVDDAIHAKGCQDNVSVLLIQLRHLEQSPSPKVAPSVDKLLVTSLKAAEANSDDQSSALGECKARSGRA